MKNARYISILILLAVLQASAYEFLGPKWPGSNPVVHYSVNEQGCEDVPDEWDHIFRSFDVWTEVPTTAIECRYDGTTPTRSVAADKNNVLYWADGSDWKLGSYVIAACYYWYQGSNLIDFDIVFNSRDFTWSTGGDATAMDIGHISTHEVGHALGLGHSDVSDAVMWPYARKGDTSHRTLHPDDSSGISALYPRTTSNNHNPVFVSTPRTEAIAGAKYQYQAQATDDDDDVVRYRLAVKPLTMTIDSNTGLVTWYPKFLDLGAKQVVIEAYDPMRATGRQSFTINVSNMVVFTRDTVIDAGDTVLFPVYVTPIDEYGVYAGNVEMSFNAAEAAVLDIDTLGSIISGSSFARNIASASVKVAFAGASPFKGEGVLFRLKTVIKGEQCGKPVLLKIQKAFFNDGDPVASIKDGTVFMECGGEFAYDIGGAVTYCGNDGGVGGATMRLVELGLSKTTSDDGSYVFEKAPRSLTGYRITAGKDSGDTRNGISAYDASLILRNIVGLKTLQDFSNQLLSADVNANTMLTAYDAALILRFLVGFDDATRIGTWKLEPQETVLRQHTSAKTDLNVRAYMIGDVSGNWNAGNDGLPKSSGSEPVTVVMNGFEAAQADEGTGSCEIFSTVVSIESRLDNIYSGEIFMQIDGTRYRLHSVRPCALLNGYTHAANQVGNEIRIAFAGTETMAQSGDLFIVELAAAEGVQAGVPGISDAVISHVLHNEYCGATRIVNRTRNVSHRERAIASGIASIYPNPVTTSVSIEFGISSARGVNCAVYDLSGRLVRTLFNGNLPVGVHRAVWDTRDEEGRKVGAQVYLLTFSCGSLVKTSRLYVVR